MTSLARVRFATTQVSGTSEIPTSSMNHMNVSRYASYDVPPIPPRIITGIASGG